jgi:hypothetical protein
MRRVLVLVGVVLAGVALSAEAVVTGKGAPDGASFLGAAVLIGALGYTLGGASDVR